MVDRKRLPPELYPRYGIKPRNQWLRAIVAGAFALVAIFVFATIGTRVTSTAEVRLITWQTLSAQQVRIEFSVFQTEDTALMCVIRAQDADRFDVGYGLAKVNHPALRPTFRVVLNTRVAAFTVPTPVCDVPNSPSLVGSHFRPGLLPPLQIGGLFAPGQQVTKSLD